MIESSRTATKWLLKVSTCCQEFKILNVKLLESDQLCNCRISTPQKCQLPPGGFSDGLQHPESSAVTPVWPQRRSRVDIWRFTEGSSESVPGSDRTRLWNIKQRKKSQTKLRPGAMTWKPGPGLARVSCLCALKKHTLTSHFCLLLRPAQEWTRFINLLPRIYSFQFVSRKTKQT